MNPRATTLLSLAAFLLLLATPPAVLAQNTGSAYLTGDGRIYATDGGPDSAFPLDPSADPSAFQITDNTMTVEAWVAPMALPENGNGHRIVIRPMDQFPWQTYSLSINNWGDVDDPVYAFEVTDGSDPYNGAYVPGPTAVVGEWVHLAGTYDGTSAKLYVNGELVQEVAFTADIGAGSSGFYIGGGLYTSERFYGLIDEVRLWETARTEAEIEADLDQTLSGSEEGLVGYWPLDEAGEAGGYPVALDMTANHNALYAGYAEFVDATPDEAPALPPALTASSVTAVAGETATITLASLIGWPVPDVSVRFGPDGMTTDGEVVRWTPPADAYGWYTYAIEAQNAHGTASDTASIWVNAAPLQDAVHSTDLVTATVANDGTFGTSYDESVFSYDGENGLFEGTLVLGLSENQVSGELYVQEFGIREPIREIASSFSGFDTAYETRYDDQRANNPIGLTVTQRSYSKDSAPDEGYVVMEYEITNTSGDDLTGLYVGTEVDWDVGDYSMNLGGYDAETGLSYMYEAEATTSASVVPSASVEALPMKGGASRKVAKRPATASSVTSSVASAPAQTDNYFGVAALNGRVSGQAVWPNLAEYWEEANFFQRMHTFAEAPTDPTDYRTSLATGPYDLAAGESVTVRFAVVGGGSLEEIKQNARAARNAADEVAVGLTPDLTVTSPSPREEGYFGEILGDVGDVDGDGAGDFIAAEYSGLGEAMYLYSGADGSFIRTLATPGADSSAIWLYGEIAAPGDVNGDGVSDFLISGATLDLAPDSTAEIVAFLVSGADDSVLRTFSSPTPVNAFDRDTDFGGAKAVLGDVNGDGTPDYAFGDSETVIEGRVDEGRAYVFDGANGSILFTLESPNIQEEGNFGREVAPAGDVNSDGVPDVAVAATGETVGGQEDAGRVYVFSGADGSLIRALLSPDYDEDTYFGDEGLFSAGDVNADGTPDLLVGEDGEAHVFSGADGSILRSISPSLEYDWFGEVLAPAQDVDGDGVPDFLIEGQAYFHGSYDSRAYVFSGADGEMIASLSPPAEGAWISDGAFLSDADGDGRPEIVLSSPEEMVDGTEYAGAVHVYYSSQIETSAEEQQAGPPVTFTLHGNYPNPFRAQTTLRYELPAAAKVRLEVFDLLGRSVATLVDGHRPAGAHEVRFDADGLASGVYLYRLEAGPSSTTRRMMLVR